MSSIPCSEKFCRNPADYLHLETKEGFCSACMFPPAMCKFCEEAGIGAEAIKHCGMCGGGICEACFRYDDRCITCNSRVCQRCLQSEYFEIDKQCKCGSIPICPCGLKEFGAEVDCMLSCAEGHCKTCKHGRCLECMEKKTCVYCANQ